MRQSATNDGVIYLFRLAFGKLSAQFIVGGVILGHDHAAAGVEIEAVNDTGTGYSSNSAELTVTMVQQGMDECAGFMAVAGMHTKPSWFVQDEQILVFEDDVQGNVFRSGFRGARFGPDDVDFISGPGRIRAFDRLAIDGDVSFEDQSLDRSARHRLINLTEVVV